MTLEEKVIDFLSRLDYVEQLDGILNLEPGIKMADYALYDKSIIVELKSFSVDPKNKIDSKIDNLISQDLYPLIFGKHDMHKALLQMPNGMKQLRDIFLNATRQVENHLRQANKQIKSAKEYLALSENTAGMLLLVNDSITSIPADEIKNRILELISSTDSNNINRFNNIDIIVYIQSTYRLDTKSGNVEIPLYIIYNYFCSKRYEPYIHKIDKLAFQWSQYENTHYAKSTDSNIKLTLNANTKDDEKEKTNQSIVEEIYRKNRYLANYNDSNFIAYGTSIYKRLMKNFIKGNIPDPEDEKIILMKLTIEFNEEARLRCFDLRKILQNIERI